MYRSVKEIAAVQGLSRRTVESRVRRFAKKNPVAFQKIQSDRAAIKASTLRMSKGLEHPTSFDDSMEPYIKEIF